MFAVTPAPPVFAADIQPYTINNIVSVTADGKGNPAMIKTLGAGKRRAAKSLNAQEQKQVLSYTRSLAK